jgi:hypothetical protein
MTTTPAVLRIGSLLFRAVCVRPGLRLAVFIVGILIGPALLQAQPGGSLKASSPNPSSSQGPGSSQPSGSSAPGGGGSSGLTGISFAKEDWDVRLGRVPTAAELGIKNEKDIIVLCYTLVAGKSAAQPFILEPWPATSFSKWEANKAYKTGEFVVPKTPNGYYYRAQSAGKSGAQDPSFGTAPASTTIDNNLKWVNAGSAAPDWAAQCANVNPSEPLLMNEIFVVAIDMTGWSDETLDRFRILNINVTNQQGTPLNPTPIRPGISAPTATIAEGAAKAKPKTRVYYLTWPNQMPGDTIPTLSINLIYRPVAPGLPWQESTFYPAGSIVIPPADGNSTTNGHYYLAVNSGFSSDKQPDFSSAAVPIPTFPVGAAGQGLTWTDMGTISVYPAPTAWQANTLFAKGSHVVPQTPNGYYYEAQQDGVSGSKSPAFPVNVGGTVPDGAKQAWLNKGLTSVNPATISNWQPSTAYAQGALVAPNPGNGHYYVASNSGISGPNPPAFPTTTGTAVTEASTLLWMDVGTTLPSSFKNLKTWASNTAFFVGDVVQDPASGHYWSVVQAGISGANKPPSSVPAPKQVTGDGGIEWQDLGTSLPSGVSSLGTTPSDQTVSLLNYTLPQVHALSYFNIASGVVVSSIRTPTFINTNNSSAPSPNWTKTNNGLTVDPILSLSVYIKPMDAERAFQKSNLIPAPTIAFSLSSPTTNYYFGGSSEFFFRNIQLVYGLSISRVQSLAPSDQQFSATTPVTRQVFAHGGFVGVSFNILGFIQSVF